MNLSMIIFILVGWVLGGMISVPIIHYEVYKDWRTRPKMKKADYFKKFVLFGPLVIPVYYGIRLVKIIKIIYND